MSALISHEATKRTRLLLLSNPHRCNYLNDTQSKGLKTKLLHVITVQWVRQGSVDGGDGEFQPGEKNENVLLISCCCCAYIYAHNDITFLSDQAGILEFKEFNLWAEITALCTYIDKCVTWFLDSEYVVKMALLSLCQWRHQTGFTWACTALFNCLMWLSMFHFNPIPRCSNTDSHHITSNLKNNFKHVVKKQPFFLSFLCAMRAHAKHWTVWI